MTFKPERNSLVEYVAIQTPNQKTHMIPTSVAQWQSLDWKKALASAIRDPAELLTLLELPNTLLSAAQKAGQLFPLRVTHSFISRMEIGNPQDPLLLQVLPLNAETQIAAEFVTDPVGDLAASPSPGLIHKYHGRVLLIATGACAVHCRYCFRRHFPYAEHTSSDSGSANLDYIKSDPSISEVILSGGDPLTLSDQRLSTMIKALNHIKHVKILRIHSRLPIFLPQRITPDLINLLVETRLKTVFVIHCNHPNEVNNEVICSLTRLQQAGITLLNQAVLLRNINDNLKTLSTLSTCLFESGVLPYYLHQLDQVQGAAHFSVSSSKGCDLIEKLQNVLPGYLVPRFVQETSGAAAKQRIC